MNFLRWRSAFTLSLLVATPASCSVDYAEPSPTYDDASSLTFTGACTGPWDCALLPLFVVCCATSANDPDAGGICMADPWFSDRPPCGLLPQLCGSGGNAPLTGRARITGEASASRRPTRRLTRHPALKRGRRTPVMRLATRGRPQPAR